jgi:prepilin-type N-terminal cleavage/methylation domain-containing protein
MKTLKNKKAFTLVELIVVIAIIGILSAVLIPSITGYIAKAKESNALQEAKAIYNVYYAYTTELAGEQTNADEQTFTEYYAKVTKETFGENESVWIAYEKVNEELTKLDENAGNVYYKNENVDTTPSYFIYKSGSIYVKVLLNGTASIASTNDYISSDFS